jgi:hypothetical protein
MLGHIWPAQPSLADTWAGSPTWRQGSHGAGARGWRRQPNLTSRRWLLVGTVVREHTGEERGPFWGLWRTEAHCRRLPTVVGSERRSSLVSDRRRGLGCWWSGRRATLGDGGGRGCGGGTRRCSEEAGIGEALGGGRRRGEPTWREWMNG